MVFFAKLPLSSLIELCRTLRHYLSSGLTLREAFALLARKGSTALRPVAERMKHGLDHGDSLEEVVQRERAAFPPLLVAILSVGEQSGNLPEVCGELEEYLRLQQKLRREFWSRSAMPLMQLAGAVVVIALLLAVLGMIAPGSGPAPDPLGFGLTGTRGAIAVLVAAVLVACGLVGAYFLITRLLGQRALVHELLLRLPAVGPCWQAMSLARLCMALRVTLETSISVMEAIRLSFRATGNAAFMVRQERVIQAVRKGGELAPALAGTRLLPEELNHILTVGEESGRLTEVLAHQARYYQEETGRRLTFLTRAAAGGVWLIVAGIIIFLIFRVAMYIGGFYRAAGI